MARPVRLETRKMCVSTAKVSAPNALFITTLAVLRPTPGRLVSTSRSAGTSPPKSRTRISDRAITFFALELNRPMVLMCCFSPSSPSATICAGVVTVLNSSRVALLTPTSVDWAESTTAISN